MSQGSIPQGSAMKDIAGAFAQLGVRIFFVLSGYLITRLLLEERDRSGTIHLGGFYARRGRRILPAAFCFMLVTFAIFRRELSLAHAAAALFFLANCDPWHPWFLGHLWSLSVEEQFYLLWPAALKRWGSVSKGGLVAIVLAAPLIRIVSHVTGQHGRWDELLFVQADILAIGCLLAFWEFERGLPRLRLPAALWLLLVVAGVTVYTGAMHFHLTAALLFVAWPALYVSIAGLLVRVMQVPPLWLNWPPVVWLGKISYGLYLWQQLFAFGMHSAFAPLAAVALAGVSYYCVERPAMRIGIGKWTAARAQPSNPPAQSQTAAD